MPERVVAVAGAGAEEDEVHEALEPARFLQAGEQLREVFREGLAGRPERFQLREQLSCADQRRAGLTFEVLPRFSKNVVELLEKAGQAA